MEEIFKTFVKEGYTNKQFEKWVNNPNVKKIYDPSQLESIKNMWKGTPMESIVDASIDFQIEVAEEIMENCKDTLEALANTKPKTKPRNKDK